MSYDRPLQKELITTYIINVSHLSGKIKVHSKFHGRVRLIDVFFTQLESNSYRNYFSPVGNLIPVRVLENPLGF